MCDEEFELGMSAFRAREIAQALAHYDAAEALGRNPDECAARRWFCWMLLGDFERAWRESDAIARGGAPDPCRLWDGEPFDGRRVVIRCLHGYGDAIQFLRYAPMVRRLASTVIVETHPEMVALLSRLDSVDEVTTWGGGESPKRDAWDQQIEVMELPRAFRATVGTIPRHVPYLCGGREAKPRAGGPLRVGFVWESSGWNPARSLPFDIFRELFEIPGIAFYSFQRGPAREELRGLSVFDTATCSPGIEDTANDLMETDLLITADTMAAHLAGALGRPVWTLLPFEADWRWMLDRENSPWYPTMRLFRQSSPGDWKSVMARVCRELRKLT